MSKFKVMMGDAYNFMIWVNEMYPEIFKEWKSVMDVQRSVEIESGEDNGI